MKKLLWITGFIYCSMLAAMDEQNDYPKSIEADICIKPSRPQYAGYLMSSWLLSTEKTEAEKALGYELEPGTLLQDVWVWDPTTNESKTDYVFKKNGKNINVMPGSLPIELLPNKEGQTIPIILHGITFFLKANQNGNRYNGKNGSSGHSTFEETKKDCLEKALTFFYPQNENTEELLKNGILQRNENGGLIPGPNNRYTNNDKNK